MTSFDYFVLIVVGASILLSVMRGLVKELLSILAWILAFIVAKFYTLELAHILPSNIPSEELRYLAAFVILFLATLLICTLLAIALSQVIKVAGMGWLDRILGGVFGLLRGVFVVSILVMLCGLTHLPQHPAWRSALLSAPLEALVGKILPWMPAAVAEKIRFE
jgi:membrane protein required for colicin V production